METKLPTLRRDLTAKVKSAVDGAFFNLLELMLTSFIDNLAAFQQQLYTRMDGKMAAVV